MKKKFLYLDDVRVPKDDHWILVKDYDEFIAKVNEFGLDGFYTISLDHDLGMGAMREWYRAVEWDGDNEINYDNIQEKTGMDCAKFLVNLSMDTGIDLPLILVHSANNVGAENIISYINNYLKSQGKNQTCMRIEIAHTCPDSLF